MAHGRPARIGRGLIDRDLIEHDLTALVPIGLARIGPGPTARNPTDARLVRRSIAPSLIGPGQTGRSLTGPAPIARARIGHGAAQTDPGRLADRRGLAKIGRPAAARFRIEDRGLRGAMTARVVREGRRAETGHRVRRWKTRSEIGPNVNKAVNDAPIAALNVVLIGLTGGPIRAGLAGHRQVVVVASSRPNGGRD